jgi:hypothetical protein
MYDGDNGSLWVQLNSEHHADGGYESGMTFYAIFPKNSACCKSGISYFDMGFLQMAKIVQSMLQFLAEKPIKPGIEISLGCSDLTYSCRVQFCGKKSV